MEHAMIKNNIISVCDLFNHGYLINTKGNWGSSDAFLYNLKLNGLITVCQLTDQGFYLFESQA